MSIQHLDVNSIPETVAGAVGRTLFLPLAVDTTSCCDEPGVWFGRVDDMSNVLANHYIWKHTL